MLRAHREQRIATGDSSCTWMFYKLLNFGRLNLYDSLYPSFLCCALFYTNAFTYARNKGRTIKLFQNIFKCLILISNIFEVCPA